jgi:hypothetical protein
MQYEFNLDMDNGAWAPILPTNLDNAGTCHGKPFRILGVANPVKMFLHIE